MNQKIPRWIVGYAILQLVLALLFGAMAYLNRGFQFPELVGNTAALFPIGLFANRNLGPVHGVDRFERNQFRRLRIISGQKLAQVIQIVVPENSLGPAIPANPFDH